MNTLENVISESVAPRRFPMLLLGLFAAIAVGLAAVGLYGVVAYSVSLRTQEIGIRMAIGAGRGDVLRMIVAGGMRVAAGRRHRRHRRRAGVVTAAADDALRRHRRRSSKLRRNRADAARGRSARLLHPRPPRHAARPAQARCASNDAAARFGASPLPYPLSRRERGLNLWRERLGPMASVATASVPRLGVRYSGLERRAHSKLKPLPRDQGEG